MIKCNSKNIDKMVNIKDHGEYKNRYGRVKDFRGDYDWGDPWVTVLVYGLNGKPYGGFPFPGSYLTNRKEVRTMAKKPEKKAVKKNGETLGVMLLTADRKASLGTMRIDPKDLDNVINAIRKFAKGTTGAFEAKK